MSEPFFARGAVFFVDSMRFYRNLVGQIQMHPVMSPKIYLTIFATAFFFNSQAFASSKANNSSSNKAEMFKDKLNSGDFSLSSSAFTENKGQVYGYDGLSHAEVKFSFQQGSTQIFLLEMGIAYQFTKVHYPEGYQELMSKKFSLSKDKGEIQNLQKQIRTETFRMDMTLVGANKNAKITSEGKSTDYTNFYTHNTLDVHSYNKITYHDIYPGIDWVIYTKNNQIKYDFVVKPGVSPSIIKMAFTNQESLKLNEDGSFTLKNSLGSITEKNPVSFQGEKSISTKFLLEKDILSFDLGNYSSNETLVIDPAIIWATYYGGAQNDYGYSSATDPLGNVYLAGMAESSLSIASGGHQNVIGSSMSAFLIKFNSAGLRLWGTYYGAEQTLGYFCACDGLGNVFLTGTTDSGANIPSGGHQNLYGGGIYDIFLVKFDGSGVRQWATYYGGTEAELNPTCSSDQLGNVYLAGYTDSPTGIASPGGFQTSYTAPYGSDGFLVKFDSQGVRQWGTYYCGGGSSYAFRFSCTSDGLGNVYLAGTVGPGSNVASGGHQNTPSYGGDAFLVKFDSQGSRLWGTYYGGNLNDIGNSCAVDALGNVYLAGTTGSNIDIASGGHQNTFGGGMFGQDAFLVKFNNSGVRQWSTYYGSDSPDEGYSCTTDAANNVYLAGYTSSTINIASGGQQNALSGSTDAFLVKFYSNGVRQWGSYYGFAGHAYTQGLCSAIDVSGNLYLAGTTNSTVNLTVGGHQTTGGGSKDAFLVKYSDNTPVGVAEFARDSKPLTVYPNPSNGEFFIETASSLNLVIFNALGEIVLRQTFPEGTNSFNLNAFANGVYLLRDENSTRTLKLIKH